jgi:Na+/H+ antiporter NhaD/arsenite permease-like protein
VCIPFSATQSSQVKKRGNAVRSKVIKAAFAGLAALFVWAIIAQPSFAAEAAVHIDGAKLGPIWAVPFIALLLSIALLPLVAPELWHHHYGKVAIAWAVAFLAPFAATYGFDAAAFELLHVMLLDYVPFIVLLFALYVVSGGIFVDGSIKGTPFVNTCFLAGGTMLASVMGTTGASVLLIRPLLRANDDRRVNMHVVIFFIFLVSNVGGALSPLGDPPLYIGFLKGVDFFWPAEHLWQETLLVAVILLGLFFLLDSILYRRDLPAPDPTPETEPPVELRGWLNIFLLAAIIAAVLATSMWQTDAKVHVLEVEVDFQNIVRTLALLGIAGVSMWATPRDYREGNHFTWGPIAEVAKLFAGIFVTIVPVIAMLKAGSSGAFAPMLTLLTAPDGGPNNAAYFWLTGGLSSFLDNAPTYLVFFNAAGGDPQALMHELPRTLAAISLGAVFMGANTYIGNAPNFMVKAIAEEAGVKMPSFFGYMLWSGVALIPTFALVTYLFFL